MSRIAVFLLFGLAIIIRRCVCEEPKWTRSDADKDKSEEEPEARFRPGRGFRPQFSGPYGPNSGPIRPVSEGHNHGFSDLSITVHRPDRPHYQDSCWCSYSFNCPGLSAGPCGKGRRYCCEFRPWDSQTYYPVKRPNYYGPVNHLLASNNYARPGHNSGYQFPEYYRPHIGFSLDRQPNGLPSKPYEDDIAIFARSGNTNSQDKKQEQGDGNASS